MSDIVTMLKRRAAAELEKKVNGALPASMHLRINPDRGDADDEDEDEDDEDEDDEDEDDEGEDEDDEGEDEDDEDGDPPMSIAFEDASREDNLACAVAAYRIGGADDCIVASHKSGPAFFGTEEDLDQYAEGKDLTGEDDWDVYDNPQQILAMEYDHDTLKRVIRMIEEKDSSYESAEDFYQKFHWGNPSTVQVVKNIPGVTGTLVHLGVARRIEYGSSKDGKWDEYFHMFGEDTKIFPGIYAVMNEGETEPSCLLIHGGNMRIEPRGVVE